MHNIIEKISSDFDSELNLSQKVSLEIDATNSEVLKEFISENYMVANSWELRVYPKPSVLKKFQQRLINSDMEQFLKEYTAASAENSDIIVTDTLDQNLFNDLNNGKTVVLFYHRDKTNQEGFYLPGSLDRCKPCIWDRGSHLGAIVYADFVQKSPVDEREAYKRTPSEDTAIE